jgi:hypothetical protein
MDLAGHGEQRLRELLEREQAAWSLPKLKLGYNRVFGYYFELSRSMAAKAPAHFIRRPRVVRVDDGDIRAVLRHAQGDGPADAAGSACDYRRFSLKHA